MQHTITSKLFFFNADTDYLPYYKNYTATIDEGKTLADLLELYTKEIRDYTSSTLMTINGLLVDGSLKIKALVDRFGSEITIEPISVYRAIKDLKINNDDFMAKLEPLASYCDQSDKVYYQSLQKEYYGSSSLKHNENYFGDAFLLLAYRLITKNSSHKDTILDIINNPQNGIGCYEVEYNTFPATNSAETILKLKDMTTKQKQSECLVAAMIEKLKTKIFPPKETTTPELRDASSADFSTLALQKSFKGFNIAVYQGKNQNNDHNELLTFVEAHKVNYDLNHKACGVDILDSAPKIAALKGADIITDAFDRSADILIVNSQEERAHLDSKAVRKAAKREINLQIITASQLLEIALGNTDKKSLGLEKAYITFI